MAPRTRVGTEGILARGAGRLPDEPAFGVSLETVPVHHTITRMATHPHSFPHDAPCTPLRACLLPLLLLLTFAPAVRADDLTDRIKQVINGPDYKPARWGILVVDAATGKTVYEHNADQLFAPASVTKLYSCAAALIELGADHRFETPVYRRGKLDRAAGSPATSSCAPPATSPSAAAPTSPARWLFADHDHIYAAPDQPRNRADRHRPARRAEGPGQAGQGGRASARSPATC